MKKLGIDLGSSSLGWFLREDDKVLNNGVITFNSGMVKDKSGGYTSPTKDRRTARSKRRLIQARKYRKIELLKVLIDYKYVPLTENELDRWSKYEKGKVREFPENEDFKKWLSCDFTYKGGIIYKNPYMLRVAAINGKIDKHELGRALYHLVQRRGYKDIGEADGETKKQIDRRGESGFKTAMNENGGIISKALLNDFLVKGERARNNYPYRAEYEKELIEICKVQGFDINLNISKEYEDDFVRKVRKAIIWQRPLRSQKGNIGKCTLELSKPRCPVSHPIFEVFRTWQYINTIKTVEYIDNKRVVEDLPIDFKRLLFNEVFLKKDNNFKFEDIKKYLDKLFGEKKEYNYLNRGTGKYDSSVSGMPVCKGLIKYFGEKVEEEISIMHTYNIGTDGHKVHKDYSVYDLWHLIFATGKEFLQDFAENKLGIRSDIRIDKNGEEYKVNSIVKFKSNAFSTSYSNLSLKAMCKIIPFLQEGFIYDDAVVLAKIPENVENWEKSKSLIFKVVSQSNIKYNYQKDIIYITNSLIDKYKALGYNENLRINEKFAEHNYQYQLSKDDKSQVKKACVFYFGEKTWEQNQNKEKIIDEVALQYQEFFYDTRRDYRKVPLFTEILKEQLNKENIEIKGKLYHHSNRENLYPKPIYSKKHEKEILDIPFIDSIKNPMFNKAMSILRRLINELLVQEYIDEDGVIQPFIDENTEIIIEVARELNDNNRRIAIERYQNERRNKREKIRQFINEFKEKNKNYSTINTEEKIPLFEMWEEQTFDEALDEKGQKVKNRNTEEIRKENKAIKRYELWLEQKGQCMYTGRMIGISQLFSLDIQEEHTIPRSLLPDNTMTNLSVCYSNYNNDVKNSRIPRECPNYNRNMDISEIGSCTAIEPRLKKWQELRDHYKSLFEINSKPIGNEDENKKNKRIQNKHYYKMHFDYWRDKINRFTADEIKESWVRRQLTDTQMVSKYAREFLKTYFKKVLVQKGSTTADFRKIFGIQGEETKDRSKHTHHCIDAAVLTLIPTNSSKRMQMLKQLYKEEENKGSITRKKPDGLHDFNPQTLIDNIEKETLIVNYQKDKITEPTYRNVRKRGKFQYLKNNAGKYIKDENGEKILLKAKGASVRGDLFQQTFIGKIRSVERDENGKPLRNEKGNWKYKTGSNEFVYVERKPISEVKTEDIIDPDIKRLVKEQRQNGVDDHKIKDHQGKYIRHIRVKTKAGKKVKNRINYKSKHDYKNNFYSAAGEIPYAVFLTKKNDSDPKNPIRNMIPVPIHEVAQTYKEYHKFTPEAYLEKFRPEIKGYQNIKLLKVGQKVFVLKNDDEYDKIKSIEFQIDRMYKITQFSEGNIWLKYHLESRDVPTIKDSTKDIKSNIVYKIEERLGLPEIKEDLSTLDNKKRKKDFEDKMFKFSNLKDYRLNRLVEAIGEEETKKLKVRLDKYKAFSSSIELEGKTPLLKTSKNNWNFLFENYDFTIDITGKIEWIKE